jgi:hypothetical protein
MKLLTGFSSPTKLVAQDDQLDFKVTPVVDRLFIDLTGDRRRRLKAIAPHLLLSLQLGASKGLMLMKSFHYDWGPIHR